MSFDPAIDLVGEFLAESATGQRMRTQQLQEDQMIKVLPLGKEAVPGLRGQQVTDELGRSSRKVEWQHRLCRPLAEHSGMIPSLFIPVGEAMIGLAEPGEQPTH